MNKARRKQLEKAASLLEELDAIFNEALGIVEECAQEEREAFDNMSDSLQSSERGERMSEIADNLETLLDTLQAIDMNDFAGTIRENLE